MGFWLEFTFGIIVFAAILITVTWLLISGRDDDE